MAGYRRYRKEQESSYALGITLTFEMLLHKAEYAKRVYVHSACRKGEAYDRLEHMCHKLQVEMVHTDKIFHILSQKENCFIIGEFRKFPPGLQGDASHVVLVNPSNGGNMGTIIRSALGFGIPRLSIIRPGVDIFDPKVVRASMGAVFQTEYAYYDSFEEYRRENGGDKRNYYPFMLDAKKRLSEVEFGGCFSLIFGNEATGLPEEYAQVGTSVIIPHSDKIDSLNLPVAVSIALYQAGINGVK